jgi:hypothetical protein
VLTLEEKERIMRESEQTNRMKSQGEIKPERKTPLSSTTTATNSNIPLMAMTPIPTSNSSTAFYKDLTSSLFDQNPAPPPPSQPFYGMSTSQTMPSMLRPIVPSSSMTQQRPTQNFSSSSNKTDLTSSLLNNINSLSTRPQTPSMNTTMNSAMPSPYFNRGTASTGSLFQPPPPPGSTVIKGSTLSSNVTQSKTAAAELDDLFN